MVSVHEVNKLLKKMFDKRIAELRALQQAPDLHPTANTILNIRIDECTVLLQRWELKGVKTDD